MPGRVSEGSPEPLGLTLDGTGANVAVYSAHAAAIELCLFDEKGDAEIERLRLPARTGGVFHGHFEGIAAGQRYGLRAYGPYAPKDGHRFNPAKLLADPYALALDRPFDFSPAMADFQVDAIGEFRPDDADSAPFMPKAIAMAPLPAKPRPHAKRPWADTVVYELHVRGFTKLHSAVPEAIRGTFAGLAHPAAIGHLVKLGVTCIEIMPAAAWIGERHLHLAGLTNYWGYNPVTLMAPDPRLAPGGWAEVAASVAAIQAAGIEVVVDVVLNHTGEGDQFGPTVSLRGLDNASYYRLMPQDRLVPVNDAGCGNILALDRPPVVRLAMDALRAWATFGGVDGFRFDLATTLGRRADGFDPAAPLLTAIAQDPVLRDLRLIAEPWDIGPGGYQIGAFHATWGEWNDKFRDSMRKFWRGDGRLLGEVATRFSGSSDIFGSRRPPSRGVNFIVAHDGFTLADLVSYERKHNEANGENNRDGTDANYSWNNGAEGETADPAILAARRRDQRNLLAALMLARGTPMIAMGAEFGHSQAGQQQCLRAGQRHRLARLGNGGRDACGVHGAASQAPGGASGADAGPFPFGRCVRCHADPGCGMAKARWRADASARLGDRTHAHRGALCARNRTGKRRIASSRCCMPGMSPSRRFCLRRAPARAGVFVWIPRGRMATRAAGRFLGEPLSGSSRARWRFSRSRPALLYMSQALGTAALHPLSSTGSRAPPAFALTGMTSTGKSTPFQMQRSWRCSPIWALPRAAMRKHGRASAASPIGRAGASCPQRWPGMRASQSVCTSRRVPAVCQPR